VSFAAPFGGFTSGREGLHTNAKGGTMLRFGRLRSAPRDLSQSELEVLVENLVSSIESERADVSIALAEVSRRLEAASEEGERSALVKLQDHLAAWLTTEGQRRLGRPRGGGPIRMCMCSSVRREMNSDNDVGDNKTAENQFGSSPTTTRAT
jgi:hypothetical protein